MTRKLSTEAQTARDELRAMLPPGSTITTTLLHTSRSGMSRTILPTIGGDDGAVIDLTWRLIRADLGLTPDRDRGGFKVGGCGMDMGFHFVYSVSRALYPDGHLCTGHTRTETRRNGRTVRGCPSNDHSNDYGELARRYDAAHRGDYGAGERPDLDVTERVAARVAYVSARQVWIAAQPTYRRTRRHSDGGYAISQRWT